MSFCNRLVNGKACSGAQCIQNQIVDICPPGQEQLREFDKQRNPKTSQHRFFPANVPQKGEAKAKGRNITTFPKKLIRK